MNRSPRGISRKVIQNAKKLLAMKESNTCEKIYSPNESISRNPIMEDSDAEYSGFREHDPRINYFVKGAPTQNFGDYLPQILAKEFMLHPRVDADIYRLVGSVI